MDIPVMIANILITIVLLAAGIGSLYKARTEKLALLIAIFCFGIAAFFIYGMAVQCDNVAVFYKCVR